MTTVETDTYHLYNMDNMEALKALPDNSVDSVVTDPPYGIDFMNAGWDKGVPTKETWAECLRVLKPGGHLLAFAGTRTQHRMATAIEDAGFEIRDLIAWCYGSGFPKSLNVSKAIDKAGGNAGLTKKIGEAIKASRVSRGLSTTECDRLFCGGTTNWSWFEGRPVGQRAPTGETFAKIAEAWPELLPLAEAVAEVEREVIGQKKSGDPVAWYGQSERGDGISDITAPATDAAKQWDGWGTALKPALEPITVARKPFKVSVAANVMEFGTGALNIDRCRVGTEGGTAKASKPTGDGNGVYGSGLHGSCERAQLDKGRWPANLIHDGSDEVVALFPVTKPTKPSKGDGKPLDTQGAGWGFKRMPSALADNGGSAARYFYCAKASKSDRDSGLEAFENREAGIKNESGRGFSETDPMKPVVRKNVHPTVKPTDLMAYLCRLVTPPCGTVLDPFMGSGSTGKAAIREGFRFIGMELDGEYFEIAAARIAAATPVKEAAE